ncbi:hypothetical protein [Comamonas testosteroni]|uniref:hypothetical protein n=1 Tax=Comamonas testosteroni TaxID=285 RepID=UPI0039191F17
MSTVNVLNVGDIDLPGLPLEVFEVPQIAGMLGCFTFAAFDKRLFRNWVAGSPQAQVIGSPTASNGYATLDGNNYIETNISETDEMSLYVVSKDAGGVSVGIFGSYATAEPRGFAFFSLDTPLVQATAAKVLPGSGFSFTTSVAATRTAFGAYGATTGSGVGTRIRNLTTGAVATSANTDARVVSPRTLKIGTFGGVFINPVSVMHAVAFSGRISEASFGLLLEWSRTAAARYGVAL